MRKRSLYGSITAMTIASALTLSAQAQTTPQTSGGSTQRSGSDQTVTVTGCVQQNNAMGMSGSGSTGTATGGTGSTAGSTAGSTGSTGSASASGSGGSGQGRFVLANAKMAQG